VLETGLGTQLGFLLGNRTVDVVKKNGFSYKKKKTVKHTVRGQTKKTKKQFFVHEIFLGFK